MKLSISLEGLDSLKTILEGIPEGITHAVVAGMWEGTATIAESAKMNAPVATGELRDSIKNDVEASGSDVVGKVTAHAEHAIYKEMGTGPKGAASPHPKGDGSMYTTDGWTYKDPKTGNFVYTTGQPATPFMYPAYEEGKDAVIAAISKAVKEATGG